MRDTAQFTCSSWYHNQRVQRSVCMCCGSGKTTGGTLQFPTRWKRNGHNCMLYYVKHSYEKLSYVLLLLRVYVHAFIQFNYEQTPSN